MKQAQKNSFKVLPSICSPDLFCVCATFRIKHAVKNISLLASSMPVRLDFFFSFLLQCSAHVFFKYYSCSILRSVNSRKAFKFLSKRLVLLLYGNQYGYPYFKHKTTYLWSMSGPGGGELSLYACPGVGNRPPRKKKIANPRGCSRGGMVTGRIEPCITLMA